MDKVELYRQVSIRHRGRLYCNATTQKCIQITALVGSGDQVIEFPHTQLAILAGKVVVMDICPGHVIDLTVGY